MKKTETFILVLTLAVGLLLRTYKINQPIADWHAWRQVDTASVTRVYLQRGVNLLYPRYYDISQIQTGYFNPEGYRFVEFPIYNLLHLGLFHILPFGFETSGRLVSILAALSSAVCLYYLGKRYVNLATGLLSAVVYLVLPFNIYFTRVILPDPLAVSFTMASIVFFSYYIDSNRRWALFTSSILFSFGMLTKPFSLFYFIPIAYLSLKKFGVKGIFSNKSLLFAVDIALVPFFLWRVWENRFLVGIPHMKWAYNGDGIRFRPAFWRWIFSERIGQLILGVWGVVPFTIGILKAKGEKKFILYFLGGAILYLVVIATANVRHDYYQTFIIPPVSLAVSYGLTSLWNSREYNKWITKAFVVFSFSMMLAMSFYEIRGFYSINHYEVVEAGREANDILPQEALVIAPYNGDTTFLYQTGRFGWPIVNESIDGMIEKGADYYVSVNKGDSDSQNFKRRFETVIESDNYIILDLHNEKSEINLNEE